MVCTIPDSNANESTVCMIKQTENKSFTKKQSIEPSILDTIATVKLISIGAKLEKEKAEIDIDPLAYFYSTYLPSTTSNFYQKIGKRFKKNLKLILL